MLNVELLELVKKHILEEPKRLDMDTWCTGRTPDQGGPACGTVGCIASWIVLLGEGKTRQQLEGMYIPGRAQALLGLGLLGHVTESARSLFFTNKWPLELARSYQEALQYEDKPKMAELTAKRIDLFIEEQTSKEKTNGT